MADYGSFFRKNGFEIFPLLSPSEFSILKSYAIDMLSNLFAKYAGRGVTEEEIRRYHLWGVKSQVPHKDMLRAANRHARANDQIRDVVINEVLTNLLKKVGVENFKLWDEGLGWLAFRLVRPGPGDGYPFSCKFWGPAKQVFSVWIPIVSFDQELMINFIPGSHLKEYPRYLPTETHFTKDEYRLDYVPKPQECVRPQMKPGEAILFHPRTLHAEEVEKGNWTRFNLEFRIEPV